ncbi:uncharacterized protein LOC5509427 isoform X3 [Nematostella vectensis]|uniref:uncharacterized protein LOC5509427 isoform X3 n=1 Tax=Nematostella vectensis TaxID=45351 RepID=UPI0020770481|nr:uncharacterized protein LOC5509427 isoform X3 [Nematostella vectensis]
MIAVKEAASNEKVARNQRRNETDALPGSPISDLSDEDTPLNSRLSTKNSTNPGRIMNKTPLKKPLINKKNGFVIPRKKKLVKELLQKQGFNTREGKDLLRNVEVAVRDPGSWSSIKIENLEFVHNDKLSSEFSAKKKSMRLAETKGNDDKLAFLFKSSRTEVKDICENGLATGSSKTVTLGDPSMGVYACRYADVVQKRPFQAGDEGYLLVFKVCKGKVKPVFETPCGSETLLEPTPNYDCHVSKTMHNLPPQPPFSSLYYSTQYYFYEFDEEGADFHVKRPRHVLPYAVLTLSVPVIEEPKLIPQQKTKKALKGPPHQRHNARKSAYSSIKTMSHPAPTEDVVGDPQVVWTGRLANKENNVANISLVSYSRKRQKLPFDIGEEINIIDKIAFELLRPLLPCPLFKSGMPTVTRVCKELLPGGQYTYFEVRCSDGKENKLVKLVSFLEAHEWASVLQYEGGAYYIYLLPTSQLTHDLAITDYHSPKRLHVLMFVKRERMLPPYQDVSFEEVISEIELGRKMVVELRTKKDIELSICRKLQQKEKSVRVEEAKSAKDVLPLLSQLKGDICREPMNVETPLDGKTSKSLNGAYLPRVLVDNTEMNAVAVENSKTDTTTRLDFKPILSIVEKLKNILADSPGNDSEPIKNVVVSSTASDIVKDPGYHTALRQIKDSSERLLVLSTKQEDRAKATKLLKNLDSLEELVAAEKGVVSSCLESDKEPVTSPVTLPDSVPGLPAVPSIMHQARDSPPLLTFFSRNDIIPGLDLNTQSTEDEKSDIPFPVTPATTTKKDKPKKNNAIDKVSTVRKDVQESFKEDAIPDIPSTTYERQLSENAQEVNKGKTANETDTGEKIKGWVLQGEMSDKPEVHEKPSNLADLGTSSKKTLAEKRGTQAIQAVYEILGLTALKASPSRTPDEDKTPVSLNLETEHYRGQQICSTTITQDNHVPETTLAEKRGAEAIQNVYNILGLNPEGMSSCDESSNKENEEIQKDAFKESDKVSTSDSKRSSVKDKSQSPSKAESSERTPRKTTEKSPSGKGVRGKDERKDSPKEARKKTSPEKRSQGARSSKGDEKRVNKKISPKDRYRDHYRPASTTPEKQINDRSKRNGPRSDPSKHREWDARAHSRERSSEREHHNGKSRRDLFREKGRNRLQLNRGQSRDLEPFGRSESPSYVPRRHDYYNTSRGSSRDSSRDRSPHHYQSPATSDRSPNYYQSPTKPGNHQLSRGSSLERDAVTYNRLSAAPYRIRSRSPESRPSDRHPRHGYNEPRSPQMERPSMSSQWPVGDAYRTEGPTHGDAYRTEGPTHGDAYRTEGTTRGAYRTEGPTHGVYRTEGPTHGYSTQQRTSDISHDTYASNGRVEFLDYERASMEINGHSYRYTVSNHPGNFATPQDLSSDSYKDPMLYNTGTHPMYTYGTNEGQSYCDPVEQECLRRHNDSKEETESVVSQTSNSLSGNRDSYRLCDMDISDNESVTNDPGHHIIALPTEQRTYGGECKRNNTSPIDFYGPDPKRPCLSDGSADPTSSYEDACPQYEPYGPVSPTVSNEPDVNSRCSSPIERTVSSQNTTEGGLAVTISHDPHDDLQQWCTPDPQTIHLYQNAEFYEDPGIESDWDRIEEDRTSQQIMYCPGSPGTPETALPSEDFTHPSINYWSYPFESSAPQQSIRLLKGTDVEFSRPLPAREDIHDVPRSTSRSQRKDLGGKSDRPRSAENRNKRDKRKISPARSGQSGKTSNKQSPRQTSRRKRPNTEEVDLSHKLTNRKRQRKVTVCGPSGVQTTHAKSSESEKRHGLPRLERKDNAGSYPRQGSEVSSIDTGDGEFSVGKERALDLKNSLDISSETEDLRDALTRAREGKARADTYERRSSCKEMGRRGKTRFFDISDRENSARKNDDCNSLQRSLGESLSKKSISDVITATGRNSGEQTATANLESTNIYHNLATASISSTVNVLDQVMLNGIQNLQNLQTENDISDKLNVGLTTGMPNVDLTSPEGNSAGPAHTDLNSNILGQAQSIIANQQTGKARDPRIKGSIVTVEELPPLPPLPPPDAQPPSLPPQPPQPPQPQHAPQSQDILALFAEAIKFGVEQGMAAKEAEAQAKMNKKKRKDDQALSRSQNRKDFCFFYVYNPEVEADQECEKVKEHMVKNGKTYLDITNPANVPMLDTCELRVLARRRYINSIHRIAHLYKLKQNPSVKFALFTSSHDVASHSRHYSTIFPGVGGVLLPDDGILRTCDPAELEALLMLIEEQNEHHQKVLWVMNIRSLAYKKLASTRPLTWRDSFVLDLLRKYRERRYVNILNRNYVSENVTSIQRYLETTLKQQSELMSSYRHFIFLSEKRPERQWFLSRGIGFMCVREYLHTYARTEAKTQQLLSRCTYKPHECMTDEAMRRYQQTMSREGISTPTDDSSTVNTPSSEISESPQNTPSRELTKSVDSGVSSGPQPRRTFSRSLSLGPSSASSQMVSRSREYDSGMDFKEERLRILSSIKKVKTNLRSSIDERPSGEGVGGNS